MNLIFNERSNKYNNFSIDKYTDALNANLLKHSTRYQNMESTFRNCEPWWHSRYCCLSY